MRRLVSEDRFPLIKAQLGVREIHHRAKRVRRKGRGYVGRDADVAVYAQLIRQRADVPALRQLIACRLAPKAQVAHGIPHDDCRRARRPHGEQQCLGRHVSDNRPSEPAAQRREDTVRPDDMGALHADGDHQSEYTEKYQQKQHGYHVPRKHVPPAQKERGRGEADVIDDHRGEYGVAADDHFRDNSSLRSSSIFSSSSIISGVISSLWIIAENISGRALISLLEKTFSA